MTTSVSSTAKVIPLISSGTAGPLGAIHLPRLWTKLTLAAAGALQDGYDSAGGGFDQMTIDTLNLKRDEVIAYVTDSKPTYLQFESWVVKKNGGSIPAAAIEKHNAAIHGYNHSDELGASMRAASGIKDASIKDAVTLNTLEDLAELHDHFTK